MANTVAGTPKSFTREIDRHPVRIDCPRGKELSLQNIGINTLWVSFDTKNWFFVASGTSFECRMEFDWLTVRTKIGRTRMVGMVTT